MVPNNKRERREHLSLDLKKRLATGHGSKSIERKLQNQGTVAKNSLTPNISKRISTKVENAYKEKDDSKYINPFYIFIIDPSYQNKLKTVFVQPDSTPQQSQSIPNPVPTHNPHNPGTKQKPHKSAKMGSFKRYAFSKPSHSQNQVSKYSYATKKGISSSSSIPPKSKDNQDAYICCARFL